MEANRQLQIEEQKKQQQKAIEDAKLTVAVSCHEESDELFSVPVQSQTQMVQNRSGKGEGADDSDSDQEEGEGIENMDLRRGQNLQAERCEQDNSFSSPVTNKRWAEDALREARSEAKRSSYEMVPFDPVLAETQTSHGGGYAVDFSMDF